MKRLYVTDLDGTLLNRQAILTENQKKIINILLDKGINFTVASARSVASIQQLLSGVNIHIPIVALNGAYIADFASGNYVKKVSIDDGQVFDILYPQGGLMSVNEQGLHKLYKFGPESEGCKEYLTDRAKRFSDTVKHITSIPSDVKVMSYTLIDTGVKLKGIMKQLRSKTHLEIDLWEDMYYEPWYWMSVHSHKATKGFAIEYLRQKYHVDEIVVFGDNTNDLDMFKKADLCFAVENAVEELKSISDDVIGHHSLNSVLKKICSMEGINVDSL